MLVTASILVLLPLRPLEKSEGLKQGISTSLCTNPPLFLTLRSIPRFSAIVTRTCLCSSNTLGTILLGTRDIFLTPCALLCTARHDMAEQQRDVNLENFISRRAACQWISRQHAARFIPKSVCNVRREAASEGAPACQLGELSLVRCRFLVGHHRPNGCWCLFCQRRWSSNRGDSRRRSCKPQLPETNVVLAPEQVDLLCLFRVDSRELRRQLCLQALVLRVDCETCQTHCIVRVSSRLCRRASHRQQISANFVGLPCKALADGLGQSLLQRQPAAHRVGH
mmetsp:Transcript_44650/g.100832  ORF Transcript_44650/g.100832 Transcript_44650/m.100832 type:complete len:281 (-) Transcript_44650:338-1180(-)